MTLHILQVTGIRFGYSKDTLVVNDVTISVQSGELAALVGPNGVGKSTLLRIMCGLLTPEKGSVLFDGTPLEQFSPRERARKIAFLPQTVQPTFSLSVFEVVCLGRYPHVGPLQGLTHHDQHVVSECLKATNCQHLTSREFGKLSGGERQRVLIAAILAQEPDILLLDEPTSLLDLHHQIEVFGLLRRLAKNRYGIIVVTHDLNTAARFCDRMILLSPKTHGIVADGPPKSVLQGPTLTEIYDAPIWVSVHPVTGTPLVTVLDKENTDE